MRRGRLVSHAVIERVIAALQAGAGGAVPMLAVADTLRRKDGKNWVTVPREGLMRAQTPQGFRFADILKAHRDHASADATDDVAIAGSGGACGGGRAGRGNQSESDHGKGFRLGGTVLGSWRSPRRRDAP